MQVELQQVIDMVSPVVYSLAGAITVLFGWIIRNLLRVEKKLDECEARHAGMASTLVAVEKKAAKLEGQVEEIKRYNPAELALEIAKHVKDLSRS